VDRSKVVGRTDERGTELVVKPGAALGSAPDRGRADRGDGVWDRYSRHHGHRSTHCNDFVTEHDTAVGSKGRTVRDVRVMEM
jgi:hypothetical protein